MNEEELDRENEYVDNYSTVEVVAIPPDFDIMQYLTMREGAGIFEQKAVDLKQLKIISDAVRCSPIFCIQNNIRISPVACMFFIKIVNELGLILKSVNNPLRINIEQCMNDFDKLIDREIVYVRGQYVKRVNYTIINIFPLMNDETINEAMEIAKNLQEVQNKFDKKLESLKLGV